MKKQRPVPTRADASGEIHTLRRALDGADLAPDERKSALAELRSEQASTNESTPTRELIIDVTSFLQHPARPNGNHVRIRDGALEDFARSFTNSPFLRDHAARDLMARGGTVVASTLERRPDGTAALRQTIKLVKPWAIEAALDGTLDRFSIGWKATGPVTCTVCGAEYERGFFGPAPSCDHSPGETYEVRRAKVLAQAEFSSADGVEVSAVSVPAVSGTSVDAIRAALAAGDTFDPAALTAALAALGDPLMCAAFEPLVAELAASQRREQTLRAQLDTRETALSAALALAPGEGVAAFESLQGELAAARAGERTAREQLQAFQVQAVVDEAVRTGKLRPKDASLEGVLRTMATTSLDGVRAYVASLPRISPVNLPLVSAGPDPTREHVAISERQKHVNELMGVTEEAFARAQRKENSHE